MNLPTMIETVKNSGAIIGVKNGGDCILLKHGEHFDYSEKEGIITIYENDKVIIKRLFEFDEIKYINKDELFKMERNYASSMEAVFIGIITVLPIVVAFSYVMAVTDLNMVRAVQLLGIAFILSPIFFFGGVRFFKMLKDHASLAQTTET